MTKKSYFWFVVLALVLAFWASKLDAQVAAINATVQDSTGQAFVNGTYRAEYVKPTTVGGYQTPVKEADGQPFTDTVAIGSLDATGTFAVALYRTDKILPRGGSWRFTICPAASAACFSYSTGITGDVNLSSQLSSAAGTIRVLSSNELFKLIPRAYNDAEIQGAQAGSRYYNLLTGKERVYNGSSWIDISGVTQTYVDALAATLNTSIGTKADDTAVVHKSGDESITGKKGFQEITIGSTFFLKDGSMAVNIKAFGAKGDGTTDDTTAIQNALTYAQSNALMRTLYFPSGRYKITLPSNGVAFPISVRGIQFLGDRGARPEDEGGTSLDFYKTSGTSIAFQLGTDNGHAYDINEYDGPQGLKFEHLELRCVNGTTPLSSGVDNYCSGTTAIKDWRGGSVTLKDVWLERWDFGFWGIQSDFDVFEDVVANYNHRALYLGPRSDQASVLKFSTIYNDIAIWLDASSGGTFSGLHLVGDGAPDNPAVRVGSSGWNVRAEGNVFDHPWLESFTGYSVAALPAYFEIGGKRTGGVWTDDTNPAFDTQIRSPHVANNPSGSLPRRKYVASIGNADGNLISYPTSQTVGNLDNVFELVGGANSWTNTYIEGGFRSPSTAFVNNGTGGTKTWNIQKSWYSGFQIRELYFRSDETSNRIRISPVNPSADRTITLNDPGANVSLPYLVGKTTRTVDLASVNSGGCTTTYSETVTGALFGDNCNGAAGTSLSSGTSLSCYVSNANTITWQYCNISGVASDRPSDTYTFRVWR